MHFLHINPLLNKLHSKTGEFSDLGLLLIFRIYMLLDICILYGVLHTVGTAGILEGILAGVV